MCNILEFMLILSFPILNDKSMQRNYVKGLGIHATKNILVFFDHIKDWDCGTQVILLS